MTGGADALGSAGDRSAELADLLDRDAIARVIKRYASSIDQKDWAALRTCFADDAEATLASGEVQRGAEAILGYIRAATGPRTFQHHLVEVYDVDLRGDEADVLTYLHSYQVSADDPDAALVLVGRYRDRFVRTADGWKLAEKRLEIGWREERRRA